MICKPCANAADYKNSSMSIDDGSIRQMHDQCKGKTHCDCQHRVGPTEQFIDTNKVKNNGNEKD